MELFFKMQFAENVLVWFFGAFTVSVFVTIFITVLSLIIVVSGVLLWFVSTIRSNFWIWPWNPLWLMSSALA